MRSRSLRPCNRLCILSYGTAICLICAYLFGENAALSIRMFLDPFEGFQRLQSLANHSPRASLEVVWAHATTQFSTVDHLQTAHSCNMHIVFFLLFFHSLMSYQQEIGSRGGERRKQRGRSTSRGRRGPIGGSLPTSPHQPSQVPANTSTYPQSIFRSSQRGISQIPLSREVDHFKDLP